MKPLKTVTALLILALLTGCGVPREAATFSAQHATASLPVDDALIRATLTHEAADWTHLAALLLEREAGGITDVDRKFTALVTRTAALARRQRDLIAAGQDNPDANRAALLQLHQLWQTADAYLSPTAP
jgi:hypothetical protein